MEIGYLHLVTYQNSPLKPQSDDFLRLLIHNLANNWIGMLGRVYDLHISLLQAPLSGEYKIMMSQWFFNLPLACTR